VPWALSRACAGWVQQPSALTDWLARRVLTGTGTLPCWTCPLQRQSEAEILRSLRAAEAQARFDYIRSRAGEVNAQEEARRHELAKKLEVSSCDGLHSNGAAIKTQPQPVLRQSTAWLSTTC
jgi:hypothetical protein